MPIPEELLQYFETPEGSRLSGPQQRALASLLDGVEIDESRLRSALFLLLSQPKKEG